jgi:shikimate 5-dehydrogenase
MGSGVGAGRVSIIGGGGTATGADFPALTASRESVWLCADKPVPASNVAAATSSRAARFSQIPLVRSIAANNATTVHLGKLSLVAKKADWKRAGAMP